MHLENSENEPYNLSITMTEYQSMLASTKESSPGSDEIKYSMIKKAHPTLQKLIMVFIKY